MPWLILSLSLSLLACSDAAAADPEETLERFLGAMVRSAEEPAALGEAFALLDEHTRVELGQRAQRAQSLSGRVYSAQDMLVAGGFRLRFDPADGAMRTEVDGDRAVVRVRGAAGQLARVPLVRQAGRWRVVLFDGRFGGR